MTNKIEQNWRKAGREICGGKTAVPTAEHEAGEQGGVSCYLASGVLDVVGQAPGVMYSK